MSAVIYVFNMHKYMPLLSDILLQVKPGIQFKFSVPSFSSFL